MPSILRISLTALAFAAFFPSSLSFAQNAGTAKSSDTPLIVETRIVAPKQAGEFQFVASNYSPEHKFSGVQLRYSHPQHPKIRFDLFVYPIGDMPREDAMAQGMKDFRKTLEAAADAGAFSDLKIVATDPFEVQPSPPKIVHGASAAGDKPPHDKDTVIESPNSPENTATTERAPSEEKSALSDDQIEALIGLAPIKGERMKLSYFADYDRTGKEVEMRSRGYLFYKQLYLFKGRISVTASEIDETAFSEIADRAMREIVPAVQAHNIGSCGNITIAINPEATEDQIADDMLKALTDAMAKTQNNNCDTEFDAHEYVQLRETAEIVSIEYVPEDWNGK